MRPPTDDRAVTVQIGTVLLFGILIVLLSVYQASVVPDQNADVEYNHNQRVHGELQDLRDEIRRTGLRGSGGSSSVTLGTQYPVRAFFVNPPSPTGSLGTAPPANVTIRNANATGETGDYWNGNARNFSTRGLVYEPNYHVYQDAPTTVHRSSVLYNRFADANVTLAGQRLVEGNVVSLVAVNGSYEETTSGTATVDLRAVSPATRTVTVRNETANLSVVVPTDRPASEWAELLADEMNESEGDDRYVLAVEKVTDRDAVRVVLEPGVYELRLAKVGVGSEVASTGAHYVTDVRGDDASVAENTTNELVVEVRDRFNNPVSDAQVSLALNSSESNDTLVYRGESRSNFSNLRTDSEGQVTVRYEAGEFNGTTREEEVNVSIVDVPNGRFDAEAKENATFDLQVYSVGGGGGGDGDDGDDDDDDDDKSNQTPTVDFRVDDLSHVDKDVVTYVASYNVSNVNGSFKRVSVVYDNIDRGPWATGVNNSTDVRGNRRYELNNGTRENWNVTVRVIYENGAGEEYVAARESITDTADALNPSANDDLSRAGSPSVEGYSITDKTNHGKGPWYRVDYTITTNGAFSRVEGAAISLGNGGATTATSSSPSDRLRLQPGYGRNSEFRIKLLVFDDDGAVVAVRAETDTAN